MNEPNPSPLYVLSIMGNRIVDVRYGMTVTNISASYIGFNYMTIHVTSGPITWGIRTNSCPNTIIDNNEIHGDAYNNMLQVGIGIVNSPNSVAIQNYVWDVGTNFYTLGSNNAGTTFLCNDVENGTTGFFFASNVSTFGPVGAVSSPSDNVWSYNVGCGLSTFTWHIFDAYTGAAPPVPWYYRDFTNCGAACFFDVNSYTGNVLPNWDCGLQTCSPPYLIANTGYDEREYFFRNTISVLVDSINTSSSYLKGFTMITCI